MARQQEEQTRRSSHQRCGLSVLEFLGCVIAVVGGMWLGALYLGIDIEALAFNALYEAEVLESIPEDLRPKTPEGHPSQFSEEEFAANLQTELVALRQEISTLRETATTTPEHVQPADGSADPTEPAASQTVAYWNRLRNIAQDEAALQSNAQAALSEENADHAFAIRARVSKFAAKAVEAIPRQQVDGELLQFGNQLAEWYRSSSGLYHRAARLWSDRNAQQSAAHLTESWETSERQLNNEAQLLANKAASVRAALIRRFRIEMVEFGG